MQAKPSRVFPKTFKPATVNRIIAIEKGAKRKYVKLSRKAPSSTSRAPSFLIHNDSACFIAKRYRRTLSHLS